MNLAYPRKTYSSGSGMGGWAEGGGPRFFNLSAILAAAFFLSSSILAKSSEEEGAGAGVSDCGTDAAGAGVGDGLMPKPGMLGGSMGPGVAGLAMDCEGGNGGSEEGGAFREGAKGGMLGGAVCWDEGNGGMLIAGGVNLGIVG